MWSGKYLRANNFDCLRFLMAVLVIFSHSYPLLYGGEGLVEPLQRVVSRNMTFGTLAVDVFFIISGFLIAMSFERSSTKRSFLRKRILRIVPGYFAATLIGVFVVAPWFVPSSSPWHSTAFYSTVGRSVATLGTPTVPGVFYRNPFPNALNGSLWTIAYEFKCYLLILLLGAAGILRKRWLMLALFLAVLALYNPHVDSLYPRFGINRPPVSNVTLRFGVYFLAGTLFYLYRGSIAYSNRLALACAVALPLCCVSESLLNVLCLNPHKFARIMIL
jgi:peptidoglycan/LPS O-acetylase OafA/YrhL